MDTPSTADTYDTGNSDRFSIDFNTLETPEYRTPTTPYNGHFLCSQLHTNNTNLVNTC